MLIIYLENQYDYNPNSIFEVDFEIEISLTFPYEVCFPFKKLFFNPYFMTMFAVNFFLKSLFIIVWSLIVRDFFFFSRDFYLNEITDTAIAVTNIYIDKYKCNT